MRIFTHKNVSRDSTLKNPGDTTVSRDAFTYQSWEGTWEDTCGITRLWLPPTGDSLLCRLRFRDVDDGGKLWGKDHLSLNDIKTQMAELLSLALESYSAVLLSTWTWYLGATVFDFDVKVPLFPASPGTVKKKKPGLVAFLKVTEEELSQGLRSEESSLAISSLDIANGMSKSGLLFQPGSGMKKTQVSFDAHVLFIPNPRKSLHSRSRDNWGC
ncbi:hypothetical protein MUG91_G91n29 [Manis pentadactyla]|nr:hypothetical protein MUG91_G91n29 [Manis pentadactyla]